MMTVMTVRYMSSALSTSDQDTLFLQASSTIQHNPKIGLTTAHDVTGGVSCSHNAYILPIRQSSTLFSERFEMGVATPDHPVVLCDDDLKSSPFLVFKRLLDLFNAKRDLLPCLVN